VGEGPDIIIGAHDWIGQLYTKRPDRTARLDDSLLANFNPVAIRAFTYDGKGVGLPYSLRRSRLYYNTDVIRSTRTWAETIELAQKLVRWQGRTWPCHPNGGGDPYHHYPLFTGFGGMFLG